MQGRNVRASNALIFGAEESESNDIEARKTHDTKITCEIFKQVGCNTPMDQLRIVRLGAFTPEKRRPIKVIFPTAEEARSLLRGKHRLPKESGMYIKYDQTILQRTHLKKLLSEMQERTNQGETNLKLRYFGGVPKIIKHNPSELSITRPAGNNTRESRDLPKN